MTQTILDFSPKKLRPDTVKWKVYQYCKENVGNVLRGKQIEEVDPEHPLSGLRMLRYLKRDNLVDYKEDKHKSKYLIVSVNGG